MLSLLAYNLFLLGVCIYALVAGGRPEKIAAAVNLVASFASAVVFRLGLADMRLFAPPIITIDLMVLLCFFWLAVRTDRFWPIWCFGFAVSDVAIHFARWFTPAKPFAYATAIAIWAYLALLALLLGTLRAARRPEDPNGGFRPWKPATPSAPPPRPPRPMSGRN